MIFKLNKYKKWLSDKEKSENIMIDKSMALSSYVDLDGMTYEYIWKHGIPVLKEWCDE